METRETNIDMLSGLPDEVLHRILSLFPTKTSVSTSVLSKRWRFLWAHVPNFRFYNHDFRGRKKKHLDIITRVVMLHEAKVVNTFSVRLSNTSSGCTYQMETLIIYLIKRRVRNLYLDFGYEEDGDIVCNFPRLLLTCKTLVDLKLVSCGVIPSTGELFLPSLKKLNLSYVDYEADESLPHLLSGCPVLEELIVNACFREEQKNSGCIIVSSLTIKKLNVDFSQGDEEEIPDEMLIIDVPSLVYLKVNCCDLDCVKSLCKTMTSLIEAEIILNGDWHKCRVDCTKHGRWIEFLSCLCHVKYLKISCERVKTLYDVVGTGSMPKFVNLTKLELNLPIDWNYVVKFLEVSDNLEVLVFQTGLVLMPYMEPKRVPTCMLSRLRTVRMGYTDISASQEHLYMMRYILRYAQVLEMMEISPRYFAFVHQKLDDLRRISLFERGSKSCQVAYNTN